MRHYSVPKNEDKKCTLVSEFVGLFRPFGPFWCLFLSFCALILETSPPALKNSKSWLRACIMYLFHTTFEVDTLCVTFFIVVDPQVGLLSTSSPPASRENARRREKYKKPEIEYYGWRREKHEYKMYHYRIGMLKNLRQHRQTDRQD